MSSRILIASACAVVLAGCQSDPVTGSVDPAFGEAVKYNAAAHIIDPDPVYSDEDMQPGENGEVGAKAVERYRTGRTKQPQRVETTSGGGTGG